MSYPQVKDPVILKCATTNDAKRIVKRALRRGWWCIVFTQQNQPHVGLSRQINLTTELRDRLENINFEVVSS